jgi:hypothetical protein
MTELEQKIKDRKTELQISYDMCNDDLDRLYTARNLLNKSIFKLLEFKKKCLIRAEEQNCLHIL